MRTAFITFQLFESKESLPALARDPEILLSLSWPGWAWHEKQVVLAHMIWLAGILQRESNPINRLKLLCNKEILKRFIGLDSLCKILANQIMCP